MVRLNKCEGTLVSSENNYCQSEYRTHTYLHESLKLEELAMQIFKVLLKKVPEPIIEHDLNKHAERLLLRHLREKNNNKLTLTKHYTTSVSMVKMS